MMSGESNDALKRAVEISLELVGIAESGDVRDTAHLDDERRRLLDSLRNRPTAIDADERLSLQKIAHLNDQAIGLLVHRRRRTEREIDMLSVGRRAVLAYSSTGLPR
jgi:hypothetical protein